MVSRKIITLHLARHLNSLSLSDYPAGLLRDDCNAEETEGTLDITFIAHNYVEANITVSWAALNLDSKITCKHA